MLPFDLSLHLLLVGVVRLLLARADNDVHKAAVVKEALVGAATGLLLLVGRLDLGGLRLDLTGTCEGTVDFACEGNNSRELEETQKCEGRGQRTQCYRELDSQRV